MATTPFPGPYPTTITHILVHHITAPTTARRAKSQGVARRQPTRQQGRSLEVLGHAIEYLIDSQLNRSLYKDDIEASQLLMRLSREVFAECPESIPAWQRLKQRLSRLIPTRQSA